MFLRFYNLEFWATPHQDEVAILEVTKPFKLEVNQGLSSIESIITRIIIEIFNLNLIGSRYMNASISILCIILVYLAMRIISNEIISLISSFLFSIQTSILVDSRYVFSAILTFFFIILSIYFYFRWRKDKKLFYFYLIFISLSIGLINYAVAIYFIIPFFAWLLILFIKISA
jgi:dolichyl-phosphate-mannose--protein O-mannosyl transferase